MKIKMRHPAYNGGANVMPEDQAKWEAAGWVAEKIKPTKNKDEE